jgi:hypothetical protein
VTSPTPARPVAPAGPTSAELVAGWLLKESGDTATTARLGLVAAAVNIMVRRWQTSPANGETWPEDLELGATMLAARLWRRRHSVDGVATFTAEGAAYVQRNDPDVALLLGLGAYAPPVVG